MVHFYSILYWRFQSGQLGKRNKRHLDWKGRGKIIPADDDIIYRNPKEFTLRKKPIRANK